LRRAAKKSKIQIERNMSQNPGPRHNIEKILKNIQGEREKFRQKSGNFNGNGRGTEPCYVVLMATGSFAPIHKDHVKMFEVAKAHLQEHHHCIVVGGLISPSHDSYVGQKLKNKTIPAFNRLGMCRVALQDSDWLSVDSWECRQPYFVDFPSVAFSLLSDIVQNLLSDQPSDGVFNPEDSKTYYPTLSKAEKSKIKVFFLCGADLALKCCLHIHPLGPVGTVVIGRHGSKNSELTQHALSPGTPLRPGKEDEFVFCETEMEDVSSSLVRERLEKGENIEDLVHSDVIKYLAANPLWWSIKK